MRDVQHVLTVSQTIATASPTSGNTATNGSLVNPTGYEGLALLLHIGSRTDGTYTPKIQVTANAGSNWYDLDAAAYVGGAAPGAQNAVGDTLIGVLYLASASNISDPTTINGVRGVVTQASGTSGATFNADFILAYPRHSGNAV